MRVGVKGMALIVTVYALLIATFAAAVNRWLHDFENAATLETSHLLAREQAGLLSERTLGALAAPDGRSRALLRERDRKSTRLNSSHQSTSRMPSSA